MVVFDWRGRLRVGGGILLGVGESTSGGMGGRCDVVRILQETGVVFKKRGMDG